MTKRFDFFICHNSRDKPTVELIAETVLETRGRHCWIDIWGIKGADDWRAAIERAMNECRSAIVFLGRSGWGKVHLEEAKLLMELEDSAGVRVVPACLPGVDERSFEELPELFKQRHRIALDYPNHNSEAVEDFVSDMIGENADEMLGRSWMSPAVIKRESRAFRKEHKRTRRVSCLKRWWVLQPFLLHGRKLTDAHGTVAEYAGLLNTRDRKYLEVCRLNERTRNRGALIVLSALLVASAIATIALRGQNKEISDQADQIGIQKTEIAKSLGLANSRLRDSEVETAGRLTSDAWRISEKHPQVAALLGVEAWRLSDRYGVYLPELDSVLRSSLANMSGVPLEGQSARTSCFAIREDSQRIAVGTEDGEVRVWDLPVSGSPIFRGIAFRHANPVAALEFQPGGTKLASVSSTGELVLVQEEDAEEDNAWRLTKLSPADGEEAVAPVIRFSGDGRWCVKVTSQSESVYLWEFALGEAPRGPAMLRARLDEVMDCDISEDGGWIAVGTREGLVHIWDTPDSAKMSDVAATTVRMLENPSGKLTPFALVPRPFGEPMRLTGETSEVHFVRFTRSSELAIILGKGKGTAAVLQRPFEARTGTFLTTHEDGTVLEAAWTLGEDRRFLIAHSPDGPRFRDLSSDGELEGTSECFMRVEGLPASFSVCGASGDGQWIVARSGEDVQRFAVDEAVTTAIARPVARIKRWSPISTVSMDGRWFAEVTDGGRVLLYDLQSSSPRREVELESRVFGIAFTPDGRALVAWCEDGPCRVLYLNTLDGDAGADLIPGRSGIRAMALSSDDRRAAWLGENGVLVVVDLISRKSSEFDTGAPGVQVFLEQHALAFSGDASHLAAPAGDGRILIVEFVPAGPTSRLLGRARDGASILGLAFGRGYSLAAVGLHMPVQRWDVANGVLVEEIDAPQPNLSEIGFLEDLLVTTSRGGDGGYTYVWRLPSQPSGSSNLCMSLASGGKLAIFQGGFAVDNAVVRLAEGGFEKVISKGASGPIEPGPKSAVAVSPDGSQLVRSGNYESFLESLTTPYARTTIFESEFLWDAAFDPAGRWLMATTRSGHALLWNLGDDVVKDPVVLPNLGKARIVCATTELLIVGYEGGEVRLWPLGMKALVDRVRRHVGRNLTESEWSAHFPTREFRRTFSDLPRWSTER